MNTFNPDHTFDSYFEWVALGGHVEARRNDKNAYGMEDEGVDDADDANAPETELFQKRRSILIDNYNYLKSIRALKLNL